MLALTDELKPNKTLSMLFDYTIPGIRMIYPNDFGRLIESELCVYDKIKNPEKNSLYLMTITDIGLEDDTINNVQLIYFNDDLYEMMTYTLIHGWARIRKIDAFMKYRYFPLIVSKPQLETLTEQYLSVKASHFDLKHMHVAA